MTSTTDLRGRLLVIRADGSSKIGLGHLMRMLALGQAWTDAGGRVAGPLGEVPPILAGSFARDGFDETTEGDGGQGGPQGADAALAWRLRVDPEALAAIDRPGLSVTDMESLGDLASRTMVVDDMAVLDAYPVALVLNQNAHADRAAYPEVQADHLLLGLRYVLLRREFRGDFPERDAPPTAERLLVTFGGGDPRGLTARTIEALSMREAASEAMQVRVIVGAANTAIEQIEALAARSPIAVTVERGSADMAGAMRWADLAITSGGSTVWELARVGTPALVVSTVPAEVSLTAGLEAVDLFDRLGPEDQLDASRLADAIRRRLADRQWRATMARRGRTLVDGQGARRVVDALAAVHAR